MAVAIFLCCLKNISVTKALKAFVVFFLSFLSVFLYLISSEFTRWYTVLWVSFLIVFFFTMGVCLNVYLRCAALLFFVHMFFSRFGLVMLFISSSWMTIQTGIGALRKNQILQNQFLMEMEEDNINPHLNSFDYLLGMIHYASLLPYFCIYIYSVLYEVTYECRRQHRRYKESSHGTMYLLCTRLFKYVVLLIVGGFFVMTLVVYFNQWHNYQNILSQFTSKNLDPSVLVECPFKWVIFYGVMSVVIAVLSFFSHFMIRFRNPIIKEHFKFTKTDVKAKKTNFYLGKASNKRMTWKEYKKYKKGKNLNSSNRTEEGIPDDLNDQVDMDDVDEGSTTSANSSDSGSNSRSMNYRKRCVMSMSNETVKYSKRRGNQSINCSKTLTPALDCDERRRRLVASKRQSKHMRSVETSQALPLNDQVVVRFDTSGSSEDDNKH